MVVSDQESGVYPKTAQQQHQHDQETQKHSKILKHVRIIENPREAEAELMQQIYAVRYRIFCEKKEWVERNHKKLEKDEFDTDNAIYVIYINPEGEVLGGYRLLPTTGPYMLKDVFPHLLGEHEAPEHPDIYEISRFGIDLDPKAEKCPHHNISTITTSLLLTLFKYAKAKQIQSIVGVTDIVMERLMRRAGLAINRFSEPYPMGNCHAVAGYSTPADIDTNIIKLEQCYSKAMAMTEKLLR